MFTRLATRVGVALSGGVDSSVAALLLKQQGYQVEGVYMKNWDEMNEKGVCPNQRDYNDVQWVCSKLGIPCHRVEFIREYWNEVFSEFISGYDQGLTPNPDLLCNERIKFGAFYRYVMETMKMDAMATGHYAQLRQEENGTVRLMQSADKFKDQTYFLATVSQSALQRTLFPIGHLTKSQVKLIACKAGLERIANKRESMGVCFIGKRRFTDFISEYLDCYPGNIVTIDGTIMGQHQGHQYYTIGQRACLGGKSEPWFVVGKNTDNNTVIVAPGHTHPALFTTVLKTHPPCWINEGNYTEITLQARLRHQQKLFPCKISKDGHGLLVQSLVPLRAVTPGQYVVFYNGEECVGGASISSSKEVVKREMDTLNDEAIPSQSQDSLQIEEEEEEGKKNQEDQGKIEENKDKTEQENEKENERECGEDNCELNAELKDGNTVNRRGQCVFVMRHGERLDSVNPHWERSTDRPYDTPLTGKGKVEAYNIALMRYGRKDINRVISSPFLRCLQTAQEVCRATGVVGVVTRNILSEIMSRGAKMRDPPVVPPPNIREYDIDILEFDNSPLPKYPESLSESLKRYTIGIQEIADEFYPDNLVLVTHQYGVERSIHLGLDGNQAEYEAVYCGNVELVREGKEGKWKTTSKHGVYEYSQLIM